MKELLYNNNDSIKVQAFASIRTNIKENKRSKKISTELFKHFLETGLKQNNIMKSLLTAFYYPAFLAVQDQHN
jgi:hypothetical protein